MRKFLLTALFTALALPASATDSGDAAFEILSKYAPEANQTNYIRLSNSIAMADAKAIDAQFSELYGAPNLTRSGLKVWEVENTKGTGVKHTTIMCGPDGKGGIFISADRRGPTANGASTKAKRAAMKKKQRANHPKHEKRTRLRSQERD